MPTHRAPPHAALGLLVAGLGIASLASSDAGRAPTAPAPTEAAVDAAVAPAESPGACALREGRRLDLNTATAADLELLPDVGPALAARIVADRDAHGGYRSVEDLDAVRGIGPRTLERLRPLVTAAPPP